MRWENNHPSAPLPASGEEVISSASWVTLARVFIGVTTGAASLFLVLGFIWAVTLVMG